MSINATDKQVRYAIYLLSEKGFSTDWMRAEHKRLGATSRERQGKVSDWLANMTRPRISWLIETLKAA